MYLNITNRCNADCVFCDRKGDAVLNGYSLKMSKEEEPPPSKYIEEIGNPKIYDEIVFCGYGEPTIRWEVVKEIANYIKKNGGKTRLNSDGHGNFINNKDITPELKGMIDSISISLNSTDPLQYSKLMRIDKSFHGEMINFAKKAKNYTRVIMSIVAINSVDADKAKEFVNNELGVEFKERNYL